MLLIEGNWRNVHSAINAKERIQFPFPVLPNSPVTYSLWSIGHRRLFTSALCSGLFLLLLSSCSLAASTQPQCLASSCCEAGLYSCSPAGSSLGLGVCCWMPASGGYVWSSPTSSSEFAWPLALPNSPVASSICPQSSYARHDGYGFCGYIPGVPKRSSSFSNNFLFIYLFLHALIFYQPVRTPKATFHTVENYFPDWQVFFINWLFSLSTKPILLSNGERVSVSVEPC